MLFGQAGRKSLKVWGDGSPYREFLYAGDVARACLELLGKEGELPQRVIVSGKRRNPDYRVGGHR